MVYSLLAVAFSIFCEKNSTIFRNAHYLSMGDQLGHSSHNNLPHSQRVHIRENNESHFFLRNVMISVIVCMELASLMWHGLCNQKSTN